MRAWWAAALASLLAAGAGSASRPAAADEPRAVEGKRVRVVGTVSEAVARQAADLLDAAMPVYEAEVPCRLPPGERLVVHLYETAKEYRAAITEAGASSLADALAGTSFITKESHLVVQPRADEGYTALVGGLPEMTRQLIYHECVHQLVARAGAPGLAWPDWYGEGMAEHVARLCLKAAAAPNAPTAIRVDDEIESVREALAAGRMIRLDRVLHSLQTELSAARRESYYAHWGSLYGLLAADADRLRALHERVKALDEADAKANAPETGRTARFEGAFADALERTYGPLDALATRWKEAVRASKPAWFEEARSVQRAGDEWVCASFPGTNAYALRVEPAPARRFSLALEWNVVDVDDRQVDVYLAHQDRDAPRLLKLAIRVEGSVTMLAYGDGAWQDRYRLYVPVPPESVTPAAWHRVGIVVDAARIAVDLDGKRVLDAAVPAGFDPLGNQIGFGVSGGVARFRALEVKPAGP